MAILSHKSHSQVKRPIVSTLGVRLYLMTSVSAPLGKASLTVSHTRHLFQKKKIENRENVYISQ